MGSDPAAIFSGVRPRSSDYTLAENRFVIAGTVSAAGVRQNCAEMPEKQQVHPLLNRVVQAACIFTAGSRELLGSRVVGKVGASL